MTSKPACLVVAMLVGAAIGVQAQTTVVPNRNNNNNYNRSTSAGSASFVGTIESVNVSNMTIEVSGRDSVVRTTTYNSNNRNSRNSNVVNNRQTTRTLEATGEEKTRTFTVSGFCKIEKEDAEEGRMGQRLTLADLKTGQRVSIDYVKGVGDKYTAKAIMPVSALKLDENAEKPKKKK